MADVKKRMAHVRAKYFYREKRGPAAARFLVQWLRETGGEKAVCRFESHTGEAIMTTLLRPANIHTVPAKDRAALECAKTYFGVDDDYTLARIMADVLFGGNNRRRPKPDLYEIACARSEMLRESPKISDGEVARRLAKTGGIYKDYDPDSLRQIVRKARLEYGRSVFLGSPRKY